MSICDCKEQTKCRMSVRAASRVVPHSPWAVVPQVPAAT